MQPECSPSLASVILMASFFPIVNSLLESSYLILASNPTGETVSLPTFIYINPRDPGWPGLHPVPSP